MNRFVRWIALLIALGGTSGAFAQTGTIQGYAVLGGTYTLVSGLSATNHQQGVIPGATITVYLTGTTTLATIYSNGTGTPLANPFTAVVAGSADAGYFIFWAAAGQGYDVVASGGGGNASCTTAPNCYTAPLTIMTDVYVSLTGGGGAPAGTGVPQVSDGAYTTTFPLPAPGLTTTSINNALGLPASATPNGGLQQTGWTKGLGFGDSRMAGSDASGLSTEFINLIASWAGYGSGNVTNYGVSGTKMADIAASVFNNYTPANTSTTMVNFEGGVNDANSMGPDEATVISNAEAAVVLMSTPRSQIVEGGDISLPTNWTTDTTYPAMTGIQSTTHGAVAVFPYTLAAATQQVGLWYTCIVGDNGSFSVVDSQNGAPVGVSTGVNPGSLASSTGLTQAPCFLPLDYARANPPGSGTVTVTVTSTTGSVHILGIGYGSANQPGIMAPGAPGVIWSDIYRLGGDRNGRNVEGFNEDLHNACNLLYGMGFYVECVAVNNYSFGTKGATNPEYALGNGTQPSTCQASAPTGTDLHMCDLGQYEWLEAAISPSSVPLSTPTQVPGFNKVFYPQVTSFNFIAQYLGIATSGANYGSAPYEFWCNYWNGSAATAQLNDFYLTVSPSSGVPTSNVLNWASNCPGQAVFNFSNVNVKTQAFSVNGGTLMTGNAGTGVNVQHSDGTGRPGYLAAFGANGDMSASGLLVANLVSGVQQTNPTPTVAWATPVNNGDTSSTTVAVGPFTAAAGAGVVCAFEYNANTTISTVADNINSGQYTFLIGKTNGWGESVYFFSATLGGSTTVTMTLATAEAFSAGICGVVTPSSPGVLTPDYSMAQSMNAVSTNPTSGTAITPAQSNEIVIGSLASGPTGISGLTAGSGFTLASGSNYGTFGALEYEIQTSPASTNAPFTLGSTTWAESQVGLYFTALTINANVIGALALAGSGTSCVQVDSTGNWTRTGAACGSGGGGGSNVSVNGGGTISSPNLNATTPAAGANSVNVAWQQSTNSVSAEITGDGTASHYLSGVGTFTTPANHGTFTFNGLAVTGAGGKYGWVQVPPGGGTIQAGAELSTTFTGCSTTNPTIEILDCGATLGTCSAPTVLLTASPSAANTPAAFTINSSTLTAGDWLVRDVSAIGSCTSYAANATVTY